MTIGERIKLRREQLGMTQEEVAKKCGYKSRSSINKIELSRSLPLKKIEIMANVLETTPSELMGWTEEGTDFIIEKEVVEVPEESSEAKELYEKYKNAIPEIRNAVDSLLKTHGQDS